MATNNNGIGLKGYLLFPVVAVLKAFGLVAGCAAQQNPVTDPSESEYPSWVPEEWRHENKSNNKNPVAQDVSANNPNAEDSTVLSEDFAATPQILDMINEARAEARNCGDKYFPPAKPVRWNNKLATAALAHAKDMAEFDYFSHCGKVQDNTPDSSIDPDLCKQKGFNDPADRAKAAGYKWLYVGENIYLGKPIMKAAMDTWIASPGHCSGIMNPLFKEAGVAYARGWSPRNNYAPNLTNGKASFWAMELGSPQ